MVTKSKTVFSYGYLIRLKYEPCRLELLWTLDSISLSRGRILQNAGDRLEKRAYRAEEP